MFGALSTRVEGTQNLLPDMTSQTRLVDVNGALGKGVRLGSIQINNGTTTTIVDLSTADTVQDVVDAINDAGIAGVTANLNGSGIRVAASAAVTLSINEVGEGTTAADLGILQKAPLAAR